MCWPTAWRSVRSAARRRVAAPRRAAGRAAAGERRGAEPAARSRRRAARRAAAARATSSAAATSATAARLTRRPGSARQLARRLARQAVAGAVDDVDVGVRAAPRYSLGEARRTSRRARPTTIVTGIVSSPTRSQNGSIAPPPIPRSAAASAGRVVAQQVLAPPPRGLRRRAREDRLRHPARRRTPRSSSPPARRRALVLGDRAARARPDRRSRPTSRRAPAACTRSGAASATCCATRPPNEYPHNTNASGAAASTSPTQPSKRDRPHAGLRAVPAEVRDERAVAFVVELGQDRVPGAVGPTEAVEQYQRLGHRPYLSHERDAATPTSSCAPSSTSCTAAASRGACTSPGSRSTPLVLTLARDGRVPVTSHVDERSAGVLRARPRAGVRAARRSWRARRARAAAQLPAGGDRGRRGRRPAVGADDRPPAGAARGRRRARRSTSSSCTGRSRSGSSRSARTRRRRERLRWIRQLACRALARRRRAAGPASCTSTSRCASRWSWTSRWRARPATAAAPDGAPWTRVVARAARPTPRRCATGCARTPARGVIVAGRGADGAARRAAGRGAGVAAARRPAVAARAAAARPSRTTTRCCATRRWAAGVAPELRPARRRPADVQAAAPVARGPRRRAAARARPGAARWPDPDAALTDVLALDPGALGAIDEVWPADAAWLGRWRDADARAAEAIAATLGDGARRAAASPRALATATPPGATVVVAASMPIRDVETFWPVARPAAARAGQPRRQRDRRHDLHRLRRRRRGSGRADLPADRRRRARPRPRRPARRRRDWASR